VSVVIAIQLGSNLLIYTTKYPKSYNIHRTAFKMYPLYVCVIIAFVCSRVEAFQSKVSFSTATTLLTNRRLYSQQPKEPAAEAERAVVAKGLTHIKYNKFAPTPEEASTMTDEVLKTQIVPYFTYILYSKLSPSIRNLGLPCISV
jgi:hypothetical protein